MNPNVIESVVPALDLDLARTDRAVVRRRDIHVPAEEIGGTLGGHRAFGLELHTLAAETDFHAAHIMYFDTPTPRRSRTKCRAGT